MNEVYRAYETEDGKLFKDRREAEKWEFGIHFEELKSFLEGRNAEKFFYASTLNTAWNKLACDRLQKVLTFISNYDAREIVRANDAKEKEQSLDKSEPPENAAEPGELEPQVFNPVPVFTPVASGE